ncbi:MAG: hypothetical protein ACR2P2_10215 [Nakamurella sp.]
MPLAAVTVMGSTGAMVVVPLAGVDVTVATGGTRTGGAELVAVGDVDTTEPTAELEPPPELEPAPPEPGGVTPDAPIDDHAPEVVPATELVDPFCSPVGVAGDPVCWEVHEVTATKAAIATAAVIR